ncbi:MAG: hypothetical protein V2A76_18980 [Planctomycetota bacterium]
MNKRFWIAAILLTGAALLAAALYLDRHPLVLPGDPADPEVSGRQPADRNPGDLVLLVGEAGRNPAEGFAALDPSFSWANLLEAEFGAYSVVSGKSGLDPGTHQACIISPSAHHRMNLERLEAFVREGGVAFVDAPLPAEGWSEGLLVLAGLELRPGAPAPFPDQDILPPGALPETDRRAFDETPFRRTASWTPLVPIDQDSRALNLSDPPLLFERSLGQGRLICSAFSVARLYLTMLQGIPEEDFSLVERLGDYKDILEPDDLVREPALRQNETPFADLLARSIAALLDQPGENGAGLPRILWYPAGSRGVYLMTHDEDLQGGASCEWLLQWDRRLGVKGTVFVISHPRLDEDWNVLNCQQVSELGGSVGLHWNLFPMPRGLGPVEPIACIQSLSSQISRLRGLSALTSGLRTNRNHYLILRSGWTRTFRALSAAGIRLDSTFGANKGRGYLFGTSRPYRILDENGLPLELRELPFINQEDWGGADELFFSRMMEANANRYRGALVSIFHPHLVVREEAGSRLFEHAARTALSTGHVAMTFEEFLAFWEARDRARVRSSGSGSERTIQFQVDRDDFLMALPLSRPGQRIGAVMNGRPWTAEEEIIGTRPYAVIRLPGGSHDLKIEPR